ncbi:hypothetical protein [Alteribacillus sp. YIM 98480]|uniref:hypothetical protein n=1 Tax=Alteribacillus sp. YIM 98480 TaxID=2606599 RepID=UPI00131E057E|nr:hypothetical protein [Alteribacillus sp. YIM 98480]
MKKYLLILGLTAALLTGCNNNADVEERFQAFATDYTPQDISHHNTPNEGKVEFDLKDEIYVRQVTRDTFFDKGEMQLHTRFSGPANKEYIDDYVAILKFSMEAPDETGFEFESMVEDIVEQKMQSNEYYFIDGTQIRMSNYPIRGYEAGEAINVTINHHLPEDMYYFDDVSKLEELGMDHRLKPHPRFLELTGNEDGVHKTIDGLISRGYDRMNGYIEHGDDKDISYYKRLDKTLESYIPYTEQALEVAEDEALKKDLAETHELLQGLEENLEDIDRYAENESILRLAEIYRDLNYYVKGDITIEKTDTTHFAKKVKEAQQNE